MESPNWIWDRDSQQGRVTHSIAKESKNMPMMPEKLNLLTLVELVGCSKMPALVLWGRTGVQPSDPPFQNIFLSGWDVSTGKDWRFGQCGPLPGCTKFVPLAQHRVLSLLSSRIASTLCPGFLEPLYLVSTLGIHGSLDHMYTCKNKHPNAAKNKTLYSFQKPVRFCRRPWEGPAQLPCVTLPTSPTGWPAACLRHGGR